MSGMRWVATHFPTPDVETMRSVTWVDERYALIHHYYYSNLWLRWKAAKVDREFFLDMDRGKFVPKDYRIISRSKRSTNYDLVYAEIENVLPSYVGVFKRVPGCDSLYGTISLSSYEYGAESYGNETRTTEFEDEEWPTDDIDWIDELKNPSKLQPTPKPVFIPDIEMLVLFALTEDGAKQIARWPVVGGSGDAMVCAADQTIGSLSIDGKKIDVRDATTGEVLTQIPIDPGAVPVSGRPSWWMYGSVVDISDVTGRSAWVYEADTGTRIPTGGTLRDWVVERRTDEYLTYQDGDYSDPNGPVPILQVRAYPSGDIKSQFEIPRRCDGILRYSADGTEIVFLSNDDEVLYVDKSTGEIREIVAPRRWDRPVSLLIGCAALLWCFVWVKTVASFGLPRWIELVGLTGFAFVFLWMRLHRSGNHELYERAAWQAIVALSIAWGLASVMRLLTPRKLSQFQRLAPLALYLAVLYYFGETLIESNWDRVSFFNHFVLGSMLIAGTIVSYRLVVGRKRLHITSLVGKAFSIRSLFAFVTAACLLAAAASRAEWEWILDFWTLDRFWDSLVTCSTLVVAAIVARIAACHSRGRYSLRIGSVVVTAACCIGVRIGWELVFCGGSFDRNLVWYESLGVAWASIFVFYGFHQPARNSPALSLPAQLKQTDG